MADVYLIVGLGNPGREYTRTRHNAGFLVVERLAERWRAGWRMNKAHQARVARVDDEGRGVMLVQPQTYMNLSGEAVAGLMGYYRVQVERVLVVVDDADLPLGTIRMRYEGSAGGHHGLESIEGRLGTRSYARQRIGIGRRREGGREITGHVLGRFSEEEWGLMERVMDRAVDQVVCWVREGVRVAMGRYNGVVEQTEQEASE